MTDPYNLQRFLDAQNPCYMTVLRELKQGRKVTHWMWFIFPQLAGLGRSEIAQFYAIGSVCEANACLTHPVLGQRLMECTRLTLEHGGQSAESIFGYPDYMKFQSCMTLFSMLNSGTSLFAAALDQFHDGRPDNKTIELLRLMGESAK